MAERQEHQKVPAPGQAKHEQLKVSPPGPGRKTRFMLVQPILDRLNGNHEAKKAAQGLGLAKEERKKLTAYLGLVDIALDGYDDIFSDFDPSPFSSRALSDDFIKELTRRYSETRHGEIKVVFSLPKALRNRDTETLIKDRLKKYFEWQLHEIQDDVKDETRRGLCYIGLGIVGITLSMVFTHYTPDIFPLKVLGEILLVPGWFGEFEGIEKIVETRVKMRKQREFYARFRDATYVFIANEELLDKMKAAQEQKDTKPSAPKDPKAAEKGDAKFGVPKDQKPDGQAEAKPEGQGSGKPSEPSPQAAPPA